MSEQTPLRLSRANDNSVTGFSEFLPAEFLGIDDGGTGATTASGARTALGLDIGTDILGYDADLAAIAGLAHSDGNFIVSNGSTWIVESGSTARDSLGLGTSNSPTFTNLTISNDLTVTGDLTVQGDTTTINTATVTVEDVLMKLADNNTTDAVDIGWYGEYVESSTTKYLGFTWDASVDKFILWTGNQSEPNTLVDTGATGHTTGTLLANIEGNVTGTLSATSTLADGVVATTQSAGDSSTKVATTAYVDTAVASEDTLAEMNDTNITSPADGALLFYDTGTSMWIDNVVSGDVVIADTGVATIQANAVQIGNIDFLVDEDNMSSNSDVKVPTQQSVKAYVDAQVDTKDTLAELDDVSFGTLANGDVLRYNGSNWINDPIDLATDTVGNFVEDVTAGDGLAKTSSAGEGQTVDLSVNVDDSSIEISSDSLQVKASGITNAMLAGSIANSKLANSTMTVGGVTLTLGATDATPAFDLTDATNYPTSSLTGTITNAQLAGSIANSKLANSSIAIGGVTFNLGDTDATPALDLSDATNYPTTSLDGTITNAQLAGSIANSKLANSSITVTDGSNSTDTALGGTITFSGTSNEIEVAESSGTITIGLPNDVTIGQNLTVTGNLDVNGTTTTIDTTNTTVTDSLIELANGTSGSPSNDSGLVIERGSADNAFIGFDESADKFIVGTGSFTGASTGNLTITTGTLVANIEGTVPESSVTAHQAALTITESQISDLQSYLTAETNDLSSAVVWANVPDANITQSSVTQHQAALSITESQISDLGSYITATSSDTLTGKTINFENNTVIVEYAVTASGGNFLIDNEANATISFSPGIVYRFDLSDSSVASHPFKLSITSDGSHNSGSEYVTGKTTNGSQGSSGAYVEYTVDAATPDILYYYCSSHSGMGGTITVFGSSYGDSDVQAYISAGSGINISNSGQISSTITQYADSDVQSYLSAGAGISISPSGQISSTITQYSDSDAQAVSINNVVEDTSPQLGGNLDINSSNITGTGNIDTTGDITITSTSDTSSAGPIINLVRDSASPADADYLGQIKFKGEDDGGASTVYAKITGKIDDASAGTEDGLIEFATIKAGSSNIAARLKTTNFQLLNGTGLEVAGNTTLSGTLNSHTIPSGTGTFALLDSAEIITSQTALSGSVDTSNDLVLLYDNSNTALRKVDVSTLLASAGAGNMNSFTLTADSGSNQTVADGNTVDIAGGDGISTVASATDTVTVNVDSTVITGQTAETSIANDDLVLIYDTSASALRKMTKSNFVSGITGGAANAFSTFAVSGQSNVVADSDTDTLTFVAGTGITLTTDASGDSITFSSSGGGGGSLPFTEFDGTNTASDPIVLSSANTAGELPLTLAGTGSDPIAMNATQQTLTSFVDADGDTKVEVERSTDNDTVHVKAGGTDVITATSSGVTITNLTVTGTTTQANELKITDTLFELNADGGSLTTDAGMIVERGSTGNNAAFIWDESLDAWVAGTTTEDGSASSNVSYTVGDLHAKTQNQSDNTTKVATTAYVDTATAGISSDTIKDGDNDTKIQVDEGGSDEDKIRYDVAGTEVATQDISGLAFTANSGTVRHNQTQAATYTIPSGEGQLMAGPVTITGTITNNGTLVIM